MPKFLIANKQEFIMTRNGPDYMPKPMYFTARQVLRQPISVPQTYPTPPFQAVWNGI